MHNKSLYRPKVKICGITSIEDALVAVDAGVDALGLVFYSPSSRNIDDLGLANELAIEVGPFVQIVSLFVDSAPAFVEKVLRHVPVNTIQFHGSESANYCEQFAHPYIKAIRMKPGISVLESAAEYVTARGILLDTYVQGQPGGTGRSFNWESVPPQLKNIVLAGGLTPDNVVEAIKIAKPYAVDVSGGVEREPGRKDKDKVRAFIKKVKLEHVSE